MDILAQRKTKGKITGKIGFNGEEVTKTEFQNHTGYVEQLDTLSPYETVDEMMDTYCRNRSDRGVTNAQIVQTINEIVQVSCG